MREFLIDPRGWSYFTVLLSDTANPTWPVEVAGVPSGQGGSVVSATAPAGLLTPVGSHILLRGVFAFSPGGAANQGVILRQADGSTAYFGGSTITISTATNPICGFAGQLAIPLYNGLCAISPTSVAARVLIAYEKIDF